MSGDRLSTADIHRRIIRTLGDAVEAHSPPEEKPLDLDLSPGLPRRIRAYAYNVTGPPGGRPVGEHKIQLIVPEQARGERGNFDTSTDRIVLLMGFAQRERVFVLWDASAYRDFAWSRNVQVSSQAVITAFAGDLGEQTRRLRGVRGVETVVTAREDNLIAGIWRRLDLTAQRLIET